MVEPYFQTKLGTLYNGDCLEVMKEIAADTIHAVVTDPPYGLSFMGKKWDYDVPAVEKWQECIRILRPGGYLLSFAGTRTQHRMAVRIEDAGFEIRDMIAWVYGQGFPKSLNIGKAVDKICGNEREVVGGGRIASTLGSNTMGGGKANPNYRHTEGSSEWEGWGTALKPAMEPITVARKPLDGTVAENALKWGTGGINIDACRVGFERPPTNTDPGKFRRWKEQDGVDRIDSNNSDIDTNKGRFPANLIHDGSDEVLKLFPENKGALAPVASGQRGFGGEIYGKYATSGDDGMTFYDGLGSAARFFYCAKANKSERDMGCGAMPEVECGVMDDDNYQWRDDVPNGRSTKKPLRRNNHPTVKPVALMEYLIKLVTVNGGVVLDPFLGSGTTAVACEKLGRRWIGIEISKEYCDIAVKRIKSVSDNQKITDWQKETPAVK